MKKKSIQTSSIFALNVGLRIMVLHIGVYSAEHSPQHKRITSHDMKRGDNMPKKDGTGPPKKSGGPRDGSGKGKGNAPGKGSGSKSGGKKGKC